MVSFYKTFLTCFLWIIILVKILSIDPKIVGGFEANQNQLPYQVSLKLEDNHKCGGTIVNLRHVVTAGHCVVSEAGKVIFLPKLKVVTGTTLRSGKDGISYYIEKINLPASFSLKSVLTSDIAVLRILGRFSFNQFVQPIALSQYEYTPGTSCIISGWGKVNSIISVPSEKLNFGIVQAIDKFSCQSQLNTQLGRDMVCAGHFAGGVDTCEGDSGGPLVCVNTLAGVVSKETKCGLLGNPGIYTAVHFHNEWIAEVLKSSSTIIKPFVSLMFTITTFKMFM